MAANALGYSIRPGRPGDGRALWTVFRQAVTVLGTSHYTGEQLKAWISRLDPQRFEHKILEMPFFVAISRKGEVAGFSSINLSTGEVEYVYVHPQHIRKSVGAELLAAAATHAKECSLSEVFVVASLNGVAFYRAMGFSSESELVRTIGGIDLSCVRMTKEL